jgi:hypothetical protein
MQAKCKQFSCYRAPENLSKNPLINTRLIGNVNV